MVSGHMCLQEVTAVAQQEAKSPSDSKSPELLARPDFSLEPSQRSMSDETRATTFTPK